MAPKTWRRLVTVTTIVLAISASRLPAAPARWTRLVSPNFEMYTTASPKNARDTLRQFEQARSFFLQTFSGPQTPSASMKPLKLIVFGSPPDSEPYWPNDFAAAYYHEMSDREYIVMRNASPETFPTAVHEYVHLVVRHAGLTLPIWLNEGLADLYSTLRPSGDKILVGDFNPSRLRRLLNDKWVPLATILAVDKSSPYYNEKSKVSSFYDESWALTHMLTFQATYRPKFDQFVHAVSDSKNPTQVLTDTYGQSVEQIEKNLQAYLGGTSFHGVLVPAKLVDTAGEVAVEPVSDFDAELILSDLLDRPGNGAAHKQALERLAQQDPKRPEPIAGLAQLALRERKQDEAAQLFAQAYEMNYRDSRFLWDYGLMLVSNQPEEAIRPLSELLKQDGTRMDVRLELADTQLRAGHAEAALATLVATHSITTADAPRYFRIAVIAHLRNNNQEAAVATARHFLELAKSDQDRELAQLLLQQATVRNVPVAPRQLSSASGQFVELDCSGKQARIIVEAADGRKVFLIEDPQNVVITAGSSGSVDMQCGVQKSKVNVQVGYEAAPPDQPEVIGVVRTLAF